MHHVYKLGPQSNFKRSNHLRPLQFKCYYALMVHITTTYLPYKKPEPSLAPEGLGP